MKKECVFSVLSQAASVVDFQTCFVGEALTCHQQRRLILDNTANPGLCPMRTFFLNLA